MSFKVVATSQSFGKINKEPYQRLLDAGCEVILNEKGGVFTEEELLTVAKDADAIIVGHDPITRNVVEQLDNIKIYAKHGVGYDNIDLESTHERGIFVTNVPGSNDNEVADLVFGLMLSVARHIPKSDKEIKDKIWTKHRGLSLYNKTIGVIGTGSIGTCVIRRAEGFSMNILANDIVENDEVLARGGKYVDLETLFKESDYITLHLPTTAETKNIIDENSLKLMKEDTVLINTARSELVDIKAITKALNSNQIYGFGTDVFDNEPPIHSDYFNHNRVVLTPHIGALTTEANYNMGNGAVEAVLAVKNGKRPKENFIRNGL